VIGRIAAITDLYQVRGDAGSVVEEGRLITPASPQPPMPNRRLVPNLRGRKATDATRERDHHFAACGVGDRFCELGTDVGGSITPHRQERLRAIAERHGGAVGEWGEGFSRRRVGLVRGFSR
jgi:hypothetical protein